MEEKLSGLLNLLTSQTEVVTQPETPLASTKSTSKPASTRDQTDLPIFRSSNVADDVQFLSDFTFSHPPECTRNPSFPSSISHFDTIQDVLSRGIVQYNQAEEALRKFRLNVHSFPFIVLPDDISIDTLRRHRPFLLLSIVVSINS